MKYIYGVDLGGTTVKMGLFDEEGNMLEKWEIVTRKENNGELILPDIAKAIADKNEEKSIDKSDIIGIGMGVPGPITEDGRVLKCANLGWGIFSVADELRKLYSALGAKYMLEDIHIDPALKEDCIEMSVAIRNRLTFMRMSRVLDYN